VPRTSAPRRIRPRGRSRFTLSILTTNVSRVCHGGVQIVCRSRRPAEDPGAAVYLRQGRAIRRRHAHRAASSAPAKRSATRGGELAAQRSAALDARQRHGRRRTRGLDRLQRLADLVDRSVGPLRQELEPLEDSGLGAVPASAAEQVRSRRGQGNPRQRAAAQSAPA
jgi:hypothetical protein